MVDDDHWKRSAIAAELDADPRIGVVDVIDQDEAVLWPLERWDDVDLAIVDVFDENAPSEVGTDVYSGISALTRLRNLPVRTFAITPHCQHPLIQLRIHQSGADWLYHRWELNDPERLIAALIDPDPEHVPKRPAEHLLAQHGARRALANDAVDAYGSSLLFGQLRQDVGIKSLHLPRRRIEAFRVRIARTGFEGTDDISYAGRTSRAPRWPDVRDYLLTLLGRRATPATEIDRDDGDFGHTEDTPH